jgi:hypothetical protein
VTNVCVEGVAAVPSALDTSRKGEKTTAFRVILFGHGDGGSGMERMSLQASIFTPCKKCRWGLEEVSVVVDCEDVAVVVVFVDVDGDVGAAAIVTSACVEL